MLKQLFAFLCLMCVCACTTTEQLETLPAPSISQHKQPDKQFLVADITLHQHTDDLISKLLSNSAQSLESGNVAVGTFLASSQLSNQSQDTQTQAMALQLQESITSILTQRGFPVLEFKTTESIHIMKNSDIMLSRDIAQLKQVHDIRYFMTGTYNQTDTGYFVNARLIDTNDNSIKAAATHFVPINVMFTEPQTSLKNGLLYRGEQQ